MSCIAELFGSGPNFGRENDNACKTRVVSFQTWLIFVEKKTCSCFLFLVPCLVSAYAPLSRCFLLKLLLPFFKGSCELLELGLLLDPLELEGWIKSQGFTSWCAFTYPVRALTCSCFFFLGYLLRFYGLGELYYVSGCFVFNLTDTQIGRVLVALFGFGGWNSQKLAISRAFFCFCTKTSTSSFIN